MHKTYISIDELLSIISAASFSKRAHGTQQEKNRMTKQHTWCWYFRTYETIQAALRDLHFDGTSIENGLLTSTSLANIVERMSQVSIRLLRRGFVEQFFRYIEYLKLQPNPSVIRSCIYLCVMWSSQQQKRTDHILTALTALLVNILLRRARSFV